MTWAQTIINVDRISKKRFCAPFIKNFFFNNGLAGIFVVKLRHPNNDRVQIIQVNCYEPKLWHSVIKTSEKDLVERRAL